MIYDKLTVLFLSTIANEKADSTNSIIASFILENIEKIRAKEYGIREIAAECHVGTASLSRFCKDIGFENFAELRELIASETAHENREKGINSANIKNCMDMVDSSISQHKLEKLCEDLLKYKKVAAFGLLKASAAALSLETDLLMFGKKIYTNFSFTEQLKYIENADKDTLIIIFSYTGSYFDYMNTPLSIDRTNAPKIWMVSGKKDRYAKYVNDVLDFSSDFSHAGHPYQLMYVENMIINKLGENMK